LSARDIVETEWIKMFGALPASTSAMDMDDQSLSMRIEDAEFEANWAIMNEIRRELELEQLESIPDEQPEYVPSIDEFNRTCCPACSYESLYQYASNHPIICRQCSYQYHRQTGSLNDIHRSHRQQHMPNCQETTLHTTLWQHDDGSIPSLLIVCTKCDFNYCL
jgi:hypothetical protein